MLNYYHQNSNYQLWLYFVWLPLQYLDRKCNFKFYFKSLYWKTYVGRQKVLWGWKTFVMKNTEISIWSKLMKTWWGRSCWYFWNIDIKIKYSEWKRFWKRLNYLLTLQFKLNWIFFRCFDWLYFRLWSLLRSV